MTRGEIIRHDAWQAVVSIDQALHCLGGRNALLPLLALASVWHAELALQVGEHAVLVAEKPLSQRLRERTRGQTASARDARCVAHGKRSGKPSAGA